MVSPEQSGCVKSDKAGAQQSDKDKDQSGNKPSGTA